MDWRRQNTGARRALWLHPEIKPTASFTGRTEELRKIGNAMQSGDTAAATQPAVVYGLGGIGKSTLAREYAYQAQDRYAGVWWLNAARAKDTLLQPVPAKPARHQNVCIADLPPLSQYGCIVDVVIDEQPGLGEATIGDELQRAWGAGIAKVEVEEWAMPEAVSYPLKESARSDLAAANAQAIATALGGLPLALSHAAAYLRENENATAESYLAAIAQHMREAPESTEYDRAVFATFQEQVGQVETRAQGARAILSLAAFYALDAIPEELFTQSAERYPRSADNPAALPSRRGLHLGC